MTYAPGDGWTISYTCDGGGGSITIGPGDAGWTKQNGAIHLSGSGDGFSLNVGRGPQCGGTSAACGPHCADGSFPSLIFADLTGSALTNNTCDCCGDVAAIWALEGSGSGEGGSGCTDSIYYGCSHEFGDAFCSKGNCINEDLSPCSDWRVDMRVDVCDAGEGHWRWTFGWGLFITGNSFNSAQCGTCTGIGYHYLGPIMTDGDTCDLSTPVELTLVSPSAPIDPKLACLGSPPSTVRLFT
jgi:hypothetical protein